MVKKLITFGNNEVKKYKFCQHKNSVLIYGENIDRIVVSNKVPFGKKVFKYFFWYKDGKKVRPLCIILPKMSAYIRDFDGTKYMSFLIKKMTNC